jgi:predicted transcriptional regulator
MNNEYYGFVYLWENTHPEAKIHKKYIGQHIGTVDDGYIGSGIIFLKKFYAKKYRGFWKRTILKYCNNIDDLNKSEYNFIAEHNACNTSEYCNIREGGKNAKLSIKTRKKMSRTLKGRTPWNKDKKGVCRQTQQTIQKRVESLNNSKQKQYEKDCKQILNYIKQKEWIRSAQIYSLLNRKCSSSVIKSRINKLLKQNKIKKEYFGANDVRYVLPSFSFEKVVLEFLNTKKDQTFYDIFSNIKERYSLRNGKDKIKYTLQDLQRQKKIKQYRGYRKNYYCLFDNCTASNYDPYYYDNI